MGREVHIVFWQLEYLLFHYCPDLAKHFNEVMLVPRCNEHICKWEITNLVASNWFITCFISNNSDQHKAIPKLIVHHMMTMYMEQGRDALFRFSIQIYKQVENRLIG